MKLLYYLLLMAVSLAVYAQNEGKHIYHVVEPGNTLYGISITYQVPVQVLREWNKMTNYTIKVGQKLIVGYEKTTTGTEAAEKQPPVMLPKTEPSKQLSSETELKSPPKASEKEQETLSLEDIGFSITWADTVKTLPDITYLLPRSNDTLIGNLIFCGGVDDDRPVGISSVFYNDPLGKNYVYVFIEKDTVFNIRNFIVDLYKTDENGQKIKISTTQYELKPRWKYTVFKHYIDTPGLYEVVVFDPNRKKLGDGQVRILSR